MRAQECIDDFSRGEIERAYACFNGDFKEKCSITEFRRLRTISADLYERFYEVSFEDIEFRITAARIEDGRGYTRSVAFVDGEPLMPTNEAEDDTEYWLREDDEWFSTDEDAKPCEPGVRS
jgi:hypothetical protein